MLFDFTKFAKHKPQFGPPELWDPLSSLVVWADVNRAIVADNMVSVVTNMCGGLLTDLCVQYIACAL